MRSIAAVIRAWLHDEKGASLIEYALLVAIVGLAVLLGMRYLGGQANAKLTTAGDNITTGS
jgi:Flp pilus assembly pilin Flp